MTYGFPVQHCQMRRLGRRPVRQAASKPLGCYGDGGAISTSDDSIALACREIRVHCQSKRYVHTRIGVGGRMDTIQCPVVLAKLERFEWEVEQRIAIGRRYNAMLDKEGIRRVIQRDDRTSVYAQYPVLLENRDAAHTKLSEAVIPTAVHYPIPLNEQPAYKHLCCPACTPYSRETATRVTNLPMSADIHEAAQAQVVSTLAAVGN